MPGCDCSNRKAPGYSRGPQRPYFDEEASPWRKSDAISGEPDDGLSELARKAARWVADHTETIRNSDPDIPEAIYNRAADNWEPLLAIADAVGGDVPEKAREAALAACGVEKDLNFSTMLLADIRDAFAERRRTDRIASAELVCRLVAMEDRPWGECNRGKALTQNELARRLKAFGIRPGTLRINGEQS